MTQQYEVRGRSTRVFTDTDGYTKVIYHDTTVVAFNADWVVLDTGGFYSSTTKTRMVQASHQFDLGYHVYQQDHVWYLVVDKGNGLDWDNPILWNYATDKMVIARSIRNG